MANPLYQRCFKSHFFIKLTDQKAKKGGFYEKYAFNSYYTVDLSNLNLEANTTLTFTEVEKSYDFKWEIISLLIRILFTLAIEVLIALLFKFHSKKQLLTILITNVITQTILNVLLNIVNYQSGELAFITAYVGLELLVFVIEAITYYVLLPKYSNQNITTKKWMPVVYALFANLASFVLGIIISVKVPGIF